MKCTRIYLAAVVVVLALAAFGCSAAEQAPVADAPAPVASLEEPTAEPALVVAEAPSEEVKGAAPEDSGQVQEPTKPAKPEMVRKPIAWPVFKFDAGVPEYDRQFVRTVVKTVQSYFVIARPKGPPVKVIIKGYWNRCPLGTSLAVSYSGGLEICLALPGWRNTDAVLNWRTVAHEWFHVVQWNLFFYREHLSIGISDIPAWLWEGSAEFAAWEALEYSGVASEAYVQDTTRYWASRVSVPLKRMVTLQQLLGASPGNADSYGVAYWAVKYLGATPQKLLLFYRRLGEGMDLQKAIKKTFGRAIDAKFYRDFEEFRARGFYS
ncbi:MAG: hypothetical protein U1E51_24640 [Candidatus Binatia bacterium]|nr:hypothetical protein [Candidatus Binatia bacterium]